MSSIWILEDLPPVREFCYQTWGQTRVTEVYDPCPGQCGGWTRRNKQILYVLSSLSLRKFLNSSPPMSKVSLPHSTLFAKRTWPRKEETWTIPGWGFQVILEKLALGCTCISYRLPCPLKKGNHKAADKNHPNLCASRISFPIPLLTQCGQHVVHLSLTPIKLNLSL